MVADRIEISIENRISAAVRDEECNEVTFSRRWRNEKCPITQQRHRAQINNTHNHYITITELM